MQGRRKVLKVEQKKRPPKRIKALFLLQLLLAFYSCGGIFTKLAGRQPFLSWGFILCYGTVILILGVYAIAWQQIIRVLPLSLAFANKAVTLVWGIVWGGVIFQEQITPGKIIGALIVMAGMLLFVTAEDHEESNNES